MATRREIRRAEDELIQTAQWLLEAREQRNTAARGVRIREKEFQAAAGRLAKLKS